ncbi:hypothetical protein Trydic_g13993 [Trypoxylus dichotomus]
MSFITVIIAAINGYTPSVIDSYQQMTHRPFTPQTSYRERVSTARRPSCDDGDGDENRMSHKSRGAITQKKLNPRETIENLIDHKLRRCTAAGGFKQAERKNFVL